MGPRLRRCGFEGIVLLRKFLKSKRKGCHRKLSGDLVVYHPTLELYLVSISNRSFAVILQTYRRQLHSQPKAPVHPGNIQRR
jgi:hypothetical protein